MRSSRRLLALATAALWLGCGSGEPEPVPGPGAEPAPAQTPAPPGERPAPAPSPAPAPPPRAEQPAPAPAATGITLEELAERIKQTSAIGTFTKLSLKNDIDDLLDALRGFHQEGEGEVRDLRNRFEALTLKVQTLLEDEEPELAGALARSREDIWGLLADPVAFARLEV